MAKKRWTSQEDALLIEAIKAGAGPKDVSRKLDRTPDAVSTRLVKLRASNVAPPAPFSNGGRKPKAQVAAMKPKGRAQRKCLSCTRTFDSDGPGNRICPRCKGLSARHSAAGAFDTAHTVRYR